MRAAETRRRRRARREARARAYREWVCGGPLVDVAAPVIGGDTDAEHLALVRRELAERHARMQRETQLLAEEFPRRCNVRLAARERMWPDLAALIDTLPGPTSMPTHSTSRMVPRPQIPMLP